MEFDDVLGQVLALLQRQGRVSYRALKIRFHLDDDYLAGIKDELIDAQQVARDEEGKVLVWTGGATEEEKANGGKGETEDKGLGSSVQRLESNDQSPTLNPRTLDSRLKDSRLDAAERRQLTVMFCDLVGSTALSEQLDPEDLREVVQAYQETCTDVIRRYEGHIAQHLGDGLLVYFGYPAAHEDDASRAVRTALGIVAAMQHLSFPTIQLPSPLQVRIGIHTGLVVIGEIGSTEKREVLALGETPNIAARLQGLAEPDTVVMSGATYHLSEGLFSCHHLGPMTVKGISVPIDVYHVLAESGLQSRFEVAVGTGLTPLVGREEELGLLQRRWAQAKESAGQVVLLNGEAGIGKSRLVQALKEQVLAEGATRIEFRCSPYHQNSALYPLIDHLQRLLQFAREDSPTVKLEKLQHMLSRYRFPQADTLPLLASLLSLPHPEGYPPITLSPQKQKQKQKTQEALVAWIVEEAEKAAVYCTWEDLHWADPSTLELLPTLFAQAPTTRMLVLLTLRPEFQPPWSTRSHINQIILSRLDHKHVETMVEKVTGGKALPTEVLQQIVAKTDGVPLFVEELTKMVIESIESMGSIGSVGSHGHASVTLGIPSTLQDTLMARLDRLAPVREIAQVGAVLGREFGYELLHAVFPVEESTLQRGLAQLVEAELLYQRGLPPQVRYIFKHALIQDAAYQSLLKSRRQQVHQQVAQVLEERFPQTVETQPELLAIHYTEAGLKEQAIPYWQQAGNNAWRRHGYREAIEHLQRGVTLVQTLPDTPERAEQELLLHIALGGPLMVAKGYAAPEVEGAYARARALCQRVENPSVLFPVLLGLWAFYNVRAELQTARALAEQLLRLADHMQNPAFLAEAQHALGNTLTHLGEPVAARPHIEAVLTSSGSLPTHVAALPSNLDPTVASHSYAAMFFWLLGYPDRAVQSSRAGVRLAQDLSAPINGCEAGFFAGLLRLFRGEGAAALTEAETLISRSAECGVLFFEVLGRMLRGGALSAQGQHQEGSAQLRHGLEIYRATGARMASPLFLAMLADASGRGGQSAEGLQTLAEAFVLTQETGERIFEAELYRLKGELLLAQAGKNQK